LPPPIAAMPGTCNVNICCWNCVPNAMASDAAAMDKAEAPGDMGGMVVVLGAANVSDLAPCRRFKFVSDSVFTGVSTEPDLN
jgi:hypothetical protein